MSAAGFVPEPAASDAVEAMYTADRDDLGYVMNLTRAWAHAPEVHAAWRAFVNAAAEAAGLDFRRKGVVISALAAELGDSYCSYAWGSRLAKAAGPEVAGGVLQGGDAGLDEAERAIAAWARTLVRDPNGTTPGDLDALRAAGLSEREIVALSAFVAGRMAFSAVNDALGVPPDAELHASAPDAVRDAIAWGRAPRA